MIEKIINAIASSRADVQCAITFTSSLSCKQLHIKYTTINTANRENIY